MDKGRGDVTAGESLVGENLLGLPCSAGIRTPGRTHVVAPRGGTGWNQHAESPGLSACDAAFARLYRMAVAERCDDRPLRGMLVGRQIEQRAYCTGCSGIVGRTASMAVLGRPGKACVSRPFRL